MQSDNKIMKQLYEISADLIMYVMAENESDAVDVARDNLSDEIHNLDMAAIRATCLFANWQDSYPYGSDDNLTVKEIFEQQIEAEKKIIEQKEYEDKHPQGQVFKN